MTMITRRRALTLTLAGLAAGTLAGCSFPTITGQKAVSLAYAAPASLDVETQNGSIEATRVEGSAVEVLATIRARTQRRLDAFAVVVVEETGGVLRVRAQPPDDRWLTGEGCSFAITTPGAYGIKARTSNGAIRLAGLAGPARLETSNGAIRVDGHDGAIEADTSNGAIELSGIAGGDVVADTSNGSITISANEPLAFDLDSSNGSITIRVPRTLTGRVRLETSNGRIRYAGLAGLGNLSDRAVDDDHVVELSLGDSTTRCRAETSNGSITLEGR